MERPRRLAMHPARLDEGRPGPAMHRRGTSELPSMRRRIQVRRTDSCKKSRHRAATAGAAENPPLFEHEADRLAETVVGLKLLFDEAGGFVRRQDARHRADFLGCASPLRVFCHFLQQ